MSLFPGPEQHAANPPTTWTVERAGRRWSLRVAGFELSRYDTRGAAEAARTSGQWAELYENERRWYAGELIPHWKPYAECTAEAARLAAWRAGR